MSQVASAQPARSRSVVSGRAEVVKSRSLWSRPSIASRTGPPTSAISSPARENRSPSSSTTGEIRISSRTALAWTSRMVGGGVASLGCGRGSSGTGGNSMPARSGTRRVVSLAVVALPVSRRAVACLLAVGAATVGVLLPSPPSSAAASTSGRTPLRVTLQSVTPAVIPPSGPVTLTGVVTNRSKQTWTDLRVYMLTSADPIRTRSKLAEQAASGAAAEVGGRVTGPGLYDVVGDLAPGQSTPYRVSVPRAQLQISGAPGVYWMGVHVLGAVNGVRDRLADGRARTFMPLVPATSAAPTRLALVVPIERAVHRGADTRLLQLRSWQQDLRGGGRRTGLLALTSRADQPLTWLVDPAVLDAAQSVATGDPGLDDGPDPTAPPARGPDGSHRRRLRRGIPVREPLALGGRG